MPARAPSRRGKEGAWDDLHETLEQARTLVGNLDASLLFEAGAARRLQEEVAPDGGETESVELRRDRDRLSALLAEAESRVARSMNLYVATYQLHATLDPDDVLTAIAEIAVDLLGAKSFVLLLRGREDGSWRVALEREMEGATFPCDHIYTGGDPVIDETLADSSVRLDPGRASGAIAAVPLRMENMTIGVLAVFETLAHQSESLSQDQELLDLLSDHAGCALVAAEAYSEAHRKLDTLSNLMSLLPGT